MAVAFNEPTPGDESELASSWMGAAGLVGMLRSAPAWHARAACRDRPDVNFFPERGESAAPAKAVCGGCPVRLDCLVHALRTPERAGVWGGLSGKQRKERRRQLGWLALGTQSSEERRVAAKLGNHRRWHVREGNWSAECPYCPDSSPHLDRDSEPVAS